MSRSSQALFFVAAFAGPALGCGDFLGAVSRQSGTECSYVKLLTNGFVEFNESLPLAVCGDAGVSGGSGQPFTAGDAGNYGDSAYLLYTSGTGRYIHQISTPVADGPTQTLLRAQLPAVYSPIIGFTQVSHKQPAYLVTTRAVYRLPDSPAANSSDSAAAVESLLDLSSLNLSTSALLVGVSSSSSSSTTPSTRLYAMDGWTLHSIELPSLVVASRFIKPAGSGSLVHLVPRHPTTPSNMSLAGLMDSGDIVLINPTTGVSTVASVTVPGAPSDPLAGQAQMGVGNELYFTTASSVFTLFLDDAPYDPPLRGSFDSKDLQGNFQYFLYPC